MDERFPMRSKSPKYLLELPADLNFKPNSMQIESAVRRAKGTEVPLRKPLTLAIVAWTFIFGAVFAAILYWSAQ